MALCTPGRHIPGWNYVETQADADDLMKRICGFHDSIITDLRYLDGGFVDIKGFMHFDRIHRLEMRFDSQFSMSIQLVFEELIDLHLAPAPENYIDLILGAELWLEDETVWLAVDSERKSPRDDSHTWVHARGLRWRFVEKPTFRLLWENPERIDDDLIKTLSSMVRNDPGRICILLAPWSLCGKECWENFARIIADQSDEVLEHYAAAIFAWLQDLNWPGSMLLYERLKKVRPGRIDRAIAETIKFAENVCRDEEWAYFLQELQSARIKI